MLRYMSDCCGLWPRKKKTVTPADIRRVQPRWPDIELQDLGSPHTKTTQAGETVASQGSKITDSAEDAQGSTPKLSAPEDMGRRPVKFELPELDAVVNRNSESEDDGQEHESQAPLLHGASTFSTMRKAMLRRLSVQPDTDSNRESTSSVGPGTIEVARRVELKRILRRRIAEDIKSEENAPGDTEPQERPESNTYGPITIPPPDRPGGGPRDTLEFTVSDPKSVRTVSIEHSSQQQQSLQVPGAKITRPPQVGQRLSSHPNATQSRQPGETGRAHVPDIRLTSPGAQERQMGIGAATSSRMPRVQSSRKGTAPERDRQLDRLSTASDDSRSGFRTWLLTQKPGSPLAAESPRSSTMPERMRVNHIQGRSSSAVNPNRRVSGDSKPNRILSLREMNISDQLASDSRRESMASDFHVSTGQRQNMASDFRFSPRQRHGMANDFRSPTGQRKNRVGGFGPSVRERQGMASDFRPSTGQRQGMTSDFGPSAGHRGNMPNNLRASVEQRRPYFDDGATDGQRSYFGDGPIRRSPEQYDSHSPTRHSAEQERLLPGDSPTRHDSGEETSAMPLVVSDGSSSRYSADNGSLKASIAESDTLGSNFQHGREIFQDYEHASYRFPSDDSPERGGDATQTKVIDDSTSSSETPSYKHREQELESVQRRFANANAVRGPPVPHSSRFKEHFETDYRPAEESPSPVPAMACTVASRGSPETRRASQQLSVPLPLNTQGLQVPRRAASAVSIGSQHSDESTVVMWQRAIKRDTQRRLSGYLDGATDDGPDNKMGSGASPATVYGPNLPPGEWLRSSRRPSGALAVSGMPTIRIVPTEESPILTEAIVEIQDCINHIGPIRSNGMGCGMADKHTDEPTTTPRPSRRAPPESWARWPSFTRDERTGSAGPSDEIKRVDFAIRHVSPTGQVYWYTDKTMGERSSQQNLLSPARWSKAMISSMGKISRAPSDMFSEDGRAWQLEYPELEILPTEAGFRELRALEGEIELMKGSVRPLTAAEETEGRKNHLSQFFPAMLRAAESPRGSSSGGFCGGRGRWRNGSKQ